MDELIGALDRAVYDTVHAFEDARTGQRGAVALAPKLAMQPGTLSNKANPLQEHQLTLRESIALQMAASDYRILRTYAWSLGHAVYALPPVTVSDVELLTQYCDFHANVGAKAIALRAALADNKITPYELDEVRSRLEALIRSGLGVLARLEVLAG
jgi:hypothetical protein